METDHCTNRGVNAWDGRRHRPIRLHPTWPDPTWRLFGIPGSMPAR